MQRDLRVLQLELRQPWNEPFGAKGGQARQVQCAAAVIAGDELQRGGFQLHQHGLNGLLVALSGRGERQALAGALEQRYGHPGFQVLDLLAHGALREVQRFGSA